MTRATKATDVVMRLLGYRVFPSAASRPYCDCCGPFRSRYLRYLTSDDFGPLYRCSGCDDE